MKTFEEFMIDLGEYTKNIVETTHKNTELTTKNITKKLKIPKGSAGWITPQDTKKHRLSIQSDFKITNNKAEGKIETGDDVDYAVFVEQGTIKQKAQPHFLPTAIEGAEYFKKKQISMLKKQKRLMNKTRTRQNQNTP